MSGVFTIVASVGTYHRPFDRFVRYLEPWSARNEARVVFQHGATSPMLGSQNHEMFSSTELLAQYLAADAIVLQGGAGGVMDARKVGRIPIVVPRIPVDHEVVDDHQVILCRKLAELGIVHVAESAEELGRLLDGTRAGTVPSHLPGRHQTPGVREAVRQLDSYQSLGAHRVERGEVVLRPPRRRLRARARLLHLVHRGALGYLLAMAVAVLLLLPLQLPPSSEALTLGVIGGWLATAFAVLPAYERTRSFAPVVWFAALLLAGLALSPLLDPAASVRLRSELLVGFGSATMLAVAVVATRVAFRHNPTVLVGETVSVRRITAHWQSCKEVTVVATCAWHGRGPDIPARSLSELIPQVIAAARRNRARSVVIASEESAAQSTLRDLAGALHRAGVECLVLMSDDNMGATLRARRIGGQLAVSTRERPGERAATALKALADRVASAIGLLMLAPALIAIAAALRLTTRQQAVLRQARTGRDGKAYQMYTFRTTTSMPGGEPQVTRLGRFLRRTSVDELPRLVNILNGDMSFVGPRPSLPSETAQYTDRMWRRLSLRPGITGLSQVSGRSRLTLAESIRIDLQYVEHRNLRVDARILARTLSVAISRDITR